ncbi:MAG: hypothetical protein JWQ96_2811 [Segetibacter sp.]|nr:hypothetical protein [Segetibacter sp.]
MLTFKKNYFILAIILFIVEVLIALFVDDGFVRPYLGDLIVVILIYCFVKAFWNQNETVVAVSVLLFAYLIEVLQYFKFVKLLGLDKSKLAVIVLGNTFHWSDILAYTLGIALVLLIEKKRLQTARV